MIIRNLDGDKIPSDSVHHRLEDCDPSPPQCQQFSSKDLCFRWFIPGNGKVEYEAAC